MPGIGHWREDLTAYPALFWTVGKYLIIYRTGVPRSVEIVAVTQGVARHPLIPSTPDALRNPVPLHVSERGTVNIQRAHHA